jgi:uncharacterized phage protein (TIGR02220 family)
MARIRCIKPELPQSESMGRVSRDARLTFIQLWTIADDEGRLRGNSRMLASLLFPYDDDAKDLIDGWLGELEVEGCLVRYKVKSDSYIQIANWLIHQKIDKPSRSKIPAFDESPRIPANPREVSSEDQGSKDQGSKDLRIKDQGADEKTLVGKNPDETDSQPVEPALDAEPEQQPGLPGMDAPAPEQPAVAKHDIEAEIVDYLNQRAGKNFEPVEANRKFVRARLAEGAAPEKIRAVIDLKVAEWEGTNQAIYLRPSTLFNAEKFAQYAGQLGARVPTLTPMRTPRKEKFDPFAYTSQTNANANTETKHEQHGDYIDVQFNEVDR